MASLTVDRIAGVHVSWLGQLVELDGDHVRVRLAPLVLAALRRRRRSCPTASARRGHWTQLGGCANSRAGHQLAVESSHRTRVYYSPRLGNPPVVTS